MKSLITGLLLLAATIVSAQTVKDAGYTFCKLSVNARGNLDGAAKMELNFGGGPKYVVAESIRKQMSDQVKKYSNMIDAINYMNESGWEMVQCMSLNGSDANVFVLFKKRVRRI